MKRKSILLLMFLLALFNSIACSTSSDETNSSKITHEELQENSIEEQVISDIDQKREINSAASSDVSYSNTDSVVEESAPSDAEPFGLEQNTIEVNNSNYEFVIGNYGHGDKQKAAFGFNNVLEGMKVYTSEKTNNFYDLVNLGLLNSDMTQISITITNKEAEFKHFYEEKTTVETTFGDVLLEKREEETITTLFGNVIIYYAKVLTSEGKEIENEIAFLNNQDTNITIIFSKKEPYDGTYNADVKEILFQMVE